jgi:hypothetical protein
MKSIKLELKKQDEDLDEISQSVSTLKHISENIGLELEAHNHMLNNLEKGMNTTRITSMYMIPYHEYYGNYCNIF